MQPVHDTSPYRPLIASFPSLRILVAGDLMLDEFIWGKVSRISPEAPVPVVNVTGESYYPGGAANVARNVREFTPSVAVMGLSGEDAAGARLMELLRSCGVNAAAVLTDAAFTTTVKTRIIARHQQVVRVDRERRALLTAAQEDAVRRAFDAALPAADGIVVADYGKGFLTQSLADYICSQTRAHGKILAVDPHPHTSLNWRGATAIKPNRAEAFLAAGMQPSEPAADPLRDEPLLEAARRLIAAWEPRLLMITLGEQGTLLFHGGGRPYHTPARAREVFDVSGAGDTSIAVLTLALAAGAAPEQAAFMANCAGGIAVGKLGTATVSPAELEAGCSAL